MSKPRVRGGIPKDSQLEDAAAHMVQDRRFVWDLAQSVTAGPPLSDITSDTQLDGYTEVYTNGSCAGGNSGFGVHSLRGEWSGRVYGAQTAQRAEVAAVVALFRTAGPLRIITDSAYVVTEGGRLMSTLAADAEGMLHADLWRFIAQSVASRFSPLCEGPCSLR